MNTVELLDEALQTARSLGFTVRQDWLSGSGGGCEIKGQRCLFVDLSLTPIEQLDQVLSAIRPYLNEGVELSAALRRKAA
jgi:hypothetical protein